MAAFAQPDRSRNSPRAKLLTSGKLPPGKYLARIMVDRSGKLEQDFQAELGSADLTAEIPIESQWPAGYGRMTVVRYVGK